jgi:small-conductance mechanosensitive channel
LLIALGIAAAVFLALLSLREIAVRWLAKRAARSPSSFDDLVVSLGRRTPMVVIAIVALYAGSFYVTLSSRPERALFAVTESAVYFQLALWASVAIDFWLARQRRRMDHDATSIVLAGVLRFVAKLILWALLLLMALSNFGVNVTALITGLGIGGVAVALALQNILSDLLASLSIVLDKPFVLGDSITVDTLTGTVESIGLKTTRLRAISGEQLIFANSDLLKSRIRNWKRLAERRVLLTFGVPYDTPPDVIERIPGMVRAQVEAQELTRFERAHFKGLGVASLDFEAVYWVLTPEYGIYMDRQQAVNLGLLRAFEREGIDFASAAQALLLTRPQENPPKTSG